MSMNISCDLHVAWNSMCAQMLDGRTVPINTIAEGELSHVVAAWEEPLRCADGDIVRVIALQYFLGESKDDYRQ